MASAPGTLNDMELVQIEPNQDSNEVCEIVSKISSINANV